MSAWTYEPTAWKNKADDPDGPAVDAEHLSRLEAAVARQFTALPVFAVRAGDPSPAAPCVRVIVDAQGRYAGGVEYDDGQPGVGTMDDDEESARVAGRVASLIGPVAGSKEES